MDNLIAKTYQTPKTVFTAKDMALIWQEQNQNNLKSKIAYYVKTGALIRLTRGIFARDKNYDPKELGASIYAPSYISFETVLREAGIIFQHYEDIFVASSWSAEKKIQGHSFVFRKIKEAVLFNPSGITNNGRYSIASAERAFLDTLYLFPKYYFDNLGLINWEKCFEIVQIYANKQLIARLKKYQKDYAK